MAIGLGMLSAALSASEPNDGFLLVCSGPMEARLGTTASCSAGFRRLSGAPSSF